MSKMKQETTYSALYTKAFALALKAHEGQTRRDGTSYFHNHILPVAMSFDEDRILQRTVAILHDIIEDTYVTAVILLEQGFSKQIVDAVVAITKIKGMSYDLYLAGVKANELSRQVKLKDMIHNLSSDPTTKQMIKYGKGLVFLCE
tara:strand:- start:7900 stop:8337 length:438 start_codon:yes stop_codon:yes gene_type:complete